MLGALAVIRSARSSTSGVSSQPNCAIRRVALRKDRPYPTQVFAVIRFDAKMSSLEHQVTVKEVVWSLELADPDLRANVP
jgi:hypothetical protein